MMPVPAQPYTRRALFLPRLIGLALLVGPTVHCGGGAVGSSSAAMPGDEARASSPDGDDRTDRAVATPGAPVTTVTPGSGGSNPPPGAPGTGSPPSGGDGEITVAARAGTGGRITPERATLRPGQTATFTVAADGGFVVDGVQGCGGSLSGDTYTTGAVSADCTVTANFRVTGSEGAGGDVQVTRTKLQTMVGLEANASFGEDDGDCDLDKMDAYKGALARRAVEGMGLDRLRLEVRSGAENPRDYFQEFLDGRIDKRTKNDNRYSQVNDNGDPNSADASGFHFTELDLKVDMVVEPVRDALRQEGRDLYLSLCYVNFKKNIDMHGDPAEYAEFMLTAVRHLESKYGIVPDALEILLEPDQSSVRCDANCFANLVKGLRERMLKEGYDFEYIGPSTVNMSNAIRYFDETVRVAGADALDELGYHKYQGVSDGAFRDVRERIEQYGIRSSMNEMMTDGHLDMERDIRDGLVSSWTKLGLSYCNSPYDLDYYSVQESNSEIIVRPSARYMGQYHRTVYRGAQRYETSSGNPYNGLAFQNPDGDWTVVVRTGVTREFTIGGLPAGTYEVFYTTDGDYQASAGDVVSDSEGLITVQIPSSGVITVHQK